MAVMYCSPSCQKIAWKHSIAPHREICKAMSKFKASHKIWLEKGGSTKRLQEWDFGCSKSISQDIVYHMELLCQEKFKFLIRHIDENIGDDPAKTLDWAKIPSRWPRVHISDIHPGSAARRAERDTLPRGAEARIDHSEG